jgi:hypothetical protein
LPGPSFLEHREKYVPNQSIKCFLVRVILVGDREEGVE